MARRPFDAPDDTPLSPAHLEMAPCDNPCCALAAVHRGACLEPVPGESAPGESAPGIAVDQV